MKYIVTFFHNRTRKPAATTPIVRPPVHAYDFILKRALERLVKQWSSFARSPRVHHAFRYENRSELNHPMTRIESSPILSG